MLCLSGFELYSRWVPLTCGEKGEKSRRTSWEHAEWGTAEVRSVIAAYRDNYDRLRSTRVAMERKACGIQLWKIF